MGVERTIRPGLVKSVSFTIDNAAAAYVQNDQLGTLQQLKVSEIANRGIWLHSVYLEDVDQLEPDLELHFFNASVTLAADNAAFTILDAAAPNYVGNVTVAEANWVDGSALDYVWLRDQDKNMPTVTNLLYMAVKLTSAAGETFTTASGVTGKILYKELFNVDK